MPLLERGARTDDGHRSNWMPYKLHDAAHRGMPIDARRQVPERIIVGLIRTMVGADWLVNARLGR